MVSGSKSQAYGGYATRGKSAARRHGGSRSGRARRLRADRECRRLERLVRRESRRLCQGR